MVAVPGESVVSVKVEHGKNHTFKKVSLAKVTSGAKRKLAPKKPMAKRQAVTREETKSAESDSSPSEEASVVAQSLLDLGEQEVEAKREIAQVRLLDDFSR